MAKTTKDEYFADFDEKMRRQAEVAKEELKRKLDVGVAKAENALDLPHQPTSRHAQAVYSSDNPKRDVELARVMIDEGRKLADSLVANDGVRAELGVDGSAVIGEYTDLVRKQQNPDRVDLSEQELIAHAYNNPLKYKRPKGPESGKLVARQIINDLSSDGQANKSLC